VCADGCKQQVYMLKEDATSPTITTTVIFITATIDAQERRNVAIADIPRAFMHADMDEQVHVHFTGPMVVQLIKVDKEVYQPCMTMEGGKKVTYVESEKALYGTMQAAWLFWD
jgi:hypothetical protein